MTATLQDIKYWIERAKEKNATHLIVAVDRFDFENYPIYVSEKQDVNDEYARIMKSDMQGIDEIYNMSMDINKQLAESRAFHIYDER